MSKRPEDQEHAERVASVTLTLTLTPSLSAEELIAFSRRAAESGESEAGRVARLIRQDIAAEATAA